jgi:hypothetical protein
MLEIVLAEAPKRVVARPRVYKYLVDGIWLSVITRRILEQKVSIDLNEVNDRIARSILQYIQKPSDKPTQSPHRPYQLLLSHMPSSIELVFGAVAFNDPTNFGGFEKQEAIFVLQA